MNNIFTIVIAGLFCLAVVSWMAALLVTRKIRHADFSKVDEFIRVRLGWGREERAKLDKLIQLRNILGISLLSSLGIAFFATIGSLRYRTAADNSISTAFIWSASLLLFSAAYCAALLVLITAVLRKYNQ